MKMNLSPKAAEEMIAANVGEGTTIYDVLTWVFGRRRIRRAVEAPKMDPEVVEFAMRIDALVHLAWKDHGITRHQGPYQE
jgi:hypothetical protein